MGAKLKKTTKVSIFYSSKANTIELDVRVMSSINNVPFDINRTAVEKNATVKKGGTVPVQPSEFVHEIEKEIPVKERRNRNRRNKARNPIFDKRFSGDRRKAPKQEDSDLTLLEKAHKSGRIIDLEV